MPREEGRVAVLVAGMHRSGTSLLTRLLGLVGCELPATLMRSADDNPTGFWESQPITDLNDEILESAGSVWNDWRAFDANWYVSPVADEYRERAQAVLLKEFGDSRLFVLKDPRICRLLRFWIDAVRNMGAQPRVISPIRNPLDVAASLEARYDIDPSLGHLIWLRHVLDAEMASRHFKRAYLRYETLYDEVHTIIDVLGDTLDVSWPRHISVDVEIEIDDFANAALHHHRTDDGKLLANPRLSRWMVSSFEILDRWCRGEVHEKDTAKLGQIRSALDAATPAFSRILAMGERGIAERDGQIEQLNGAVAEYERSTGNLDQGIAERDERLHVLSHTVAERDARINGLNHTVTERDGRVDALTRTVTDLEGRIEVLSHAAARHDEQTEAFDHTLSERDGQIEALNHTLSERDGQIEAFNHTLSERDGQIEALNHTLSERDGQIEALHHTLSERDGQIEALDRTLSERDGETEALNRTLSERDGQIEALNRTATARSGRIESLLEVVSERDARIGELDRTLTARDHRIERLNSELSDHSSRTGELARTAAASRNQVEQLNRMVLERDDRIEGLNQVVATLKGENEDLNQAMDERNRRSGSPERAPIRRDGMSIGFFSICARNYIPYARALYRSLRAQYHEVSFYLVLADRIDGQSELGTAEEFPILEAKSFGIEDFDGMAFRYDVTEFSTAIKPSCFTHLFERYEHDALVYLDPDIYIVNQMAEVELHLAEGADVILTPHICAPIEDGGLPNDLTILRSGTYNLGFLALADTTQVRSLLQWWAARLKHDCRMDLDQGLHVDQKWMDLSPAFVEQTKILHHEGYNVAYWNLLHREVRKTSKGWFVNGSPLVFFHFSGAELSDPDVLSKHQNRFDSRNIGDLNDLLHEYRTKVTECGFPDCSKIPYAYDYSIDGRKIHVLVRRTYREEVEPVGQRADPWHTAVEFCNAAALDTADDRQLLITRIMHRIWRERADLQQAFDLNTPGGRRGFVEWYLHSAISEVGLDSVFVDDVAQRYFSEDLRLRKDAGYRRKIFRWALSTAAPKLSFIYRRFPVGMRSRAKAFLLRGSYFTDSPAGSRPASGRRAPASGGKDPSGSTSDRGVNETVLQKNRHLEPGALLVGYPRAEMGMGEHVRLSAKAFTTTDVGFGILDVSHNVAARQEDDRFSRYIIQDPRYRTNIFHINADQMDDARTVLGSDFFDDRYNIGYWMWELSEFPDAWLQALDMVDEVWAPSRFVQQAIAAKARCPVLWMPLAVDMNGTSRITRDDLALPNDHFLFLFNFDFSSHFNRKNPLGIISAFRRNFQEEKVKLVLKTMSLEWHDKEVQELKDVIDGDSRIILIDRILSFEENFALESCCDAFVSLHRSEGFGRGMAELMALGKPVVATSYSGNADFTLDGNSCPVDYRLIPVESGQYPYGDGQVWADPDIEQAGWYMRRLVDDPSYGRQLGETAKEFILENHSPEVIGARYAQRLDILGMV